MIEYRIGGELWRCEKFDDLQAEMENGLTAITMPEFHAMISTGLDSFRKIRRLFGLQPVEPPDNMNPDDFRIWTRPELARDLGIKAAEITETLSGVRGRWMTVARRLVETQAASPADPGTPRLQAEKPPGELFSELDFRGHPLLREFNFNIKFRSMEERHNFAAKVEAFERVLREPLVSGLGTNALNTRFTLDRLLQKLNDDGNYLSDKKGYREDLAMSQELGKNYDLSIEKILQLCPWASQIAGKHALQPVISTITQCYLEYRKRGDTKLVDGVFTAMGIKVEFRSTKQMPSPRYRFGLVLAINAAKEGVLDPTYKCPFTQAELKKMDTIGREAIKAVSIAEGEGVVDLQSDDPTEGEFPDLAPPAKTE